MTAPELDGIAWHKSSYSAERGDCVEVGWHKSSYSAESGACVESAPTLDRVLVRDSKDPGGPALAFPIPSWGAFLSTATH